MTGSTTILGLSQGSAKVTDVLPGVDVTDTSIITTGYTKKYNQYDIFDLYSNLLGFNTYLPASYSTVGSDLGGTYNNGVVGIGATITGPSTPSSSLLLTVDGISPTAGQRILIKDQTNHPENGIYIVTNNNGINPWIITRSQDCNSPITIINNTNILVLLGNTLSNTFWQLNVSSPVTVGTSSIIFNKFTVSSSLPVFPLAAEDGGTGVTNAHSSTITLAAPMTTGGIFTTEGDFQALGTVSFGGNLAIEGSSNLTMFVTAPTAITLPPGVNTLIATPGSIGITTLGTITTGTWHGTKIGVNYGGTGLSSTTANQLLYSPSDNVINGLETNPNSVLITNGSGIPTIVSLLPTAVQNNITTVGTVATGTNLLPYNFVSNLSTVYLSGTTISVHAGKCKNSTNAYDMVLGSNTTLNLAVNGLNGLDTGSFAQNTWYAIYIIGDSTNLHASGTLAVAGTTSPTLPTNYNIYRRVGWIRSKPASAAVINFIQMGNSQIRTYNWVDDIAYVTGLSAGSTAGTFSSQSLANVLPPTVQSGRFNALWNPTVETDIFCFIPTGNSTSFANCANKYESTVSSKNDIRLVYIVTDASQSIDYATTQNTDSLSLYANSYEDNL